MISILVFMEGECNFFYNILYYIRLNTISILVFMEGECNKLDDITKDTKRTKNFNPCFYGGRMQLMGGRNGRGFR